MDIGVIEDFVSGVPEKYADFCKRAIDEIHRLHTSGGLSAVFHKEDAKEAEPLLAEWERDRLSTQDTLKLLDMLYVTGQQLYGCEEVPEWKSYVDKYQQHLFGDEDERFRHTYAVLEDCTGVWPDKKGHYKGPPKASERITRCTEFFLGLTDYDGKPQKTTGSVGAELRDRLDTAEQNIRLFLATKAALDAAAEAVGLDIPGNEGTLAGPNMRLDSFTELYNMRLEEIQQQRRSQESGETRLEKALKMSPAIDPEKLKPSAEALKQLKADILKDAQGEEWLRTKVRSLEYGDGFSFKELVNP